MPSASLDFRGRCGRFLFVFLGFMHRRVLFKISMRVRVLRVRNKMTGVMVGLVLSVFFFEDLLLRCGDVESNPGPDPAKKPESMKQTQLCSGRRDSGGKPAAESSTSGIKTRSASASDTRTAEPTNSDLMEMLLSLSSQFADMQKDMKEMKEAHESVQAEITQLKNAVADLVADNDRLREENSQLRSRVEDLASKTDDLECRSKRNNLIFYGLHRPENESTQDCEDTVRELLTDKLELSKDIQFDRVHRLNGKPDSPVIARCTLYKDKVLILKEKRKLKGTNVFVGEDFSVRVREIRKRLSDHLKTARSQGKRATLVFDHIFIEGKKFVLGGDGQLTEHA